MLSQKILAEELDDFLSNDDTRTTKELIDMVRNTLYGRGNVYRDTPAADLGMSVIAKQRYADYFTRCADAVTETMKIIDRISSEYPELDTKR